MATVARVCSVLTLLLLVQDALCQTEFTEFFNSTTEGVDVTELDTNVTVEVAEAVPPSATGADPSGGSTYVIIEETTSQSDPDFGIRYYLYTRDHPVSYFVLGNDSLLKNTDFDVKRPTIFLIHGFTGSGDTTSVSLIKDALLYTEDINVISVHWEDLAKGPDYQMAANNTIIAAQHLARTIERLVREEGVPLSSLHVIGFSLGAHVAGIAGSLLTIGKLPRLTALDPAGPMFHKKTEEWRLDPSDAEFVLVLHTSGGFVSFDEPLGHADFYPNGGKSPQPACEEQVVKLVCSHLIAPLYFAESIYKPKAFAAMRCASWTEYIEGLCQECEPTFFGPHTPSSARGMYFLRTGSQEPYGLGTGSDIKDNRVDNEERRAGRTVELQEGMDNIVLPPDAQAKGSSGPKPMKIILLTVCTALVKALIPSL
ncbi:inactive pancreatic lipase-related protein 1 isoform X2 [Anabrus simplex]|uniref:inactive pancreatic lipase-related protein 1 isoform X2 n=1 Tax=Anabrus simplex TaxID=316456 RepID=UPI0035A32638